MTHAEIASYLRASIFLAEKTKDPLIQSGIAHLSKALQRATPGETNLSDLEECVVRNVDACANAFYVLYRKHVIESDTEIGTDQ